jgi:xanthine dehydrogenase molybdopterin-binding subunit B
LRRAGLSAPRERTDGQAHGGIAQGVGQALLEDTHYDPASGQLLTASFMDYAMPRADNLPWLETELSEIPSPTNRLGVRSAGEGGTTPALAAVINAVVDALAELGVSHIELPATPSACGARSKRQAKDARTSNLRHATIALRWGPGLSPRSSPGKHDVACNVDRAAQ